MNNPLRSFFIALSFLTRIPVPLKGDVSQQEIGQSMLFYPLVGLLIGCILWLTMQLLCFLSSGFPADVMAAVVLTLWVLITGGLHMDGLADTADAWVGGQHSRSRTLEIMKDPYCGPIGVAVVVLVLLLKWSALSYLFKSGQNAFILVLPMFSRAVILALFMSAEYVRESGLGSAILEQMPDQKALWSVLTISLLLSLMVIGFWALLLAFAALYGLRAMMLKRIGGMTGDTIGACVEIAEAAALIGIVL